MGSQKNYRIVVLILVIFFVISFLTNILGALNPSVSSSFMLTETMAGFLPFAFFIAYGIMSIPSGFLLEKYGAKKLMVVAFALSLFGALLFALFPTFGVFLITLFCIGTAMAVLQVVINPLLRVAGGEEHYAFTSVLAQLIFGAASFLSPQVYSWLVFHLGDKANAQGWLIRNLSQFSAIRYGMGFDVLALCRDQPGHDIRDLDHGIAERWRLRRRKRWGPRKATLTCSKRKR